MESVFTQGFILQAGLILALGAQNLFLIDVGIKRTNHFLAALICSICDMLLIFLGVMGISELLEGVAELKLVIAIIGSTFLFYYSFLKFKEIFQTKSITQVSGSGLSSKKMIISSTLCFTLLNPHVYIDAFFLVGGYSSKFHNLNDKFYFALGAAGFSCLWFFFLVTFSSRFHIFLQKTSVLRFTSFLTCLVLGFLGFKMGKESYLLLNSLIV